MLANGSGASPPEQPDEEERDSEDRRFPMPETKGQRAWGKAPTNRGQNTTVLAAMTREVIARAASAAHPGTQLYRRAHRTGAGPGHLATDAPG